MLCRGLLVLTFAVLAVAASIAQESSTHQESLSKGPIQDNSFLVEEAYNQEFGVVQHINSVTRFAGNNWAYTFTQEWPIRGQKHQLSYTLARQNSGAGAGWGDALFNYRYQLIGSGETKVAIAPRISLILGSGDYRRSLGGGSNGVQYNLPASIIISQKLVMYTNVGGTYLPHARNPKGDTAFATGYNLGQSFIWLARERVNFMLESIFTGNDSVVESHEVRRAHDAFISPGVRWSYNCRNGVQIVPGVATPFGLGPHAPKHGIIVYLSIEHPFRKIRAENQ